jgi:hypothetical protein
MHLQFFTLPRAVFSSLALGIELFAEKLFVVRALLRVIVVKPFAERVEHSVNP